MAGLPWRGRRADIAEGQVRRKHKRELTLSEVPWTEGDAGCMRFACRAYGRYRYLNRRDEPTGGSG